MATAGWLLIKEVIQKADGIHKQHPSAFDAVSAIFTGGRPQFQLLQQVGRSLYPKPDC